MPQPDGPLFDELNPISASFSPTARTPSRQAAGVSPLFLFLYPSEGFSLFEYGPPFTIVT